MLFMSTKDYATIVQLGKNDGNTGDLTGIVTGYIRPTTCYLGGPPINGSITMSLTVTANKGYNIGVYIGLNRANAETDVGDSSCLVRTFEASDATLNSGRVEQIDNDECWDFGKGSNNDGTVFGFQINDFEIQYIPSDSGTVTISACFVWDQNDKNYCPGNCTNTTIQTKCLLQGAESVSFAPPLFR
jgi:hypothetical protein